MRPEYTSGIRLVGMSPAGIIPDANCMPADAGMTGGGMLGGGMPGGGMLGGGMPGGGMLGGGMPGGGMRGGGMPGSIPVGCMPYGNGTAVP